MSLDWIENELEQLSSANLLRHRVTRTGKLGATIVVDGKSYINFGPNDYLGLAADPKLQTVVNETLEQSGWGSGASPLILGRGELHAELENQLADFLDAEAALLFPTGFAANAGSIPALVGKEDVVFSDAKNHASIIDGCRLSGAKTVVYPHLNVDALAKALAQESGAKKLIVSDSLFSMDGDVAPLKQLANLAEQHDAMLMIDEAHALGATGKTGAGVAEEMGVTHRIDIRVGTLSKCFGSPGGFVAGSRRLVEYLSNRARTYVFSTAAPIAATAAALAALRMIREQPERRHRLKTIADRLRTQLRGQGWQVPTAGTHIVPVTIGDPSRTLEIASRLRDNGFWVPCIRPPSVPDGESLLRISLSSSHDDEMIESLLGAFVAMH